MTTEVGSASEVKKESEPLGADATKEKPKEVAENQQNQSSDPEEEKGSQSSPTAESQSSPRRQKRDKDPSESRGISRFIPPWLKKQKSYTLVAAKDGGDKKEPAQAVGEEVSDKEESLPEGEGQAKGDAEETAQRKQQEMKVDVKEEKPSVSHPEAQVCLRTNFLEMKAWCFNHIQKGICFFGILSRFLIFTYSFGLPCLEYGAWGGLPRPSHYVFFKSLSK